MPAEVARSEVVFSICPPHAALDVARLGPFEGIYVDANAISPAKAREVGAGRGRRGRRRRDRRLAAA